MAVYTAVDKSTDYFDTQLYTGNGGTTTVTGVPFEPDMSWLKNRSALGDHEIYDKVRGATYRVYPNSSAAQDSLAQGLQAWTSDGFRVGNNSAINGNGNNLVSWNWLANGNGASNTNGSINTIKTSASTASGFSISTYTGTETAATIGHGLGVAPTAIWVKKISASEQWFCWNKGLTSAGGFLKLDVTNAAATNNTAFPWNPQATTFGISTDGATNGNGVTYYALCFAEKQGFSKMGSYLGNASTNGAFIYCGFKPAFVLIKNTAATEAWFLYDNKRGVNGAMNALFPDENAADGGAADNIDLLSNGFKLRTAGAILNSAATFIFMAFAENPFVTSTGIPTPAR
jgi:hypothetical protein